MTRSRPFKQVDVFTAVAFKGNPVAVILDANGLTTGAMQAIANWTNLSETTFVTAATDPAADYAVRIFTPKSELPFAGHPTLGTAHAVLEAGRAALTDGKIVQQCAAGLVEISQTSEGLSFQLPRYSCESAPDAPQLLQALGEGATKGEPQIVNVGPRWVIAEMDSAERLAMLKPDYAILAAYDRAHGTTGLTVFATKSDDTVVVRSFAPADGINEDPVCGSGNAAVAAYRLRLGQITRTTAYSAFQGREVGRDGRIQVRIENGNIHIGGACITVINGDFVFDA